MISSEWSRWTRALGDLVNHDSVVVRLLSLWTLCVVLFFAAWTVAYYLLPEGLLRRSAHPVATTTVADTTVREFLVIFAWNIGFCLIVLLANTFRSVRTPMGYLVVLVMWIQGAIIWGTNSLAIQTGRLAPSLTVMVERSGFFELTAFVVVAVATRGVTVWHQQSGPRLREEFERVGTPQDWTITRQELVVLLSGVLLLALANYQEARMLIEMVG